MKSSQDVLIKCSAVTKEYGVGEAKVTALRGINLEVYRGELLILAGPSGCGKTTLISIIGGILKRDAGTCSILGKDVEEMNTAERARFRGTSIGFVFQTFNLLHSLSIAENVAVPLLISGEERKVALQRARIVLIRLDFRDAKMHFPVNSVVDSSSVSPSRVRLCMSLKSLFVTNQRVVWIMPRDMP